MTELRQQDPVLYQERIPAGRLVTCLLAMGVAVSVLVLALCAASGEIQSEPAGMAIGFAVTVLLVFLIWNYRAIHIRVTPESIEVRYGLFNRKVIAPGDVVTCEPTTAPFRRYGGIGVRLGLDGSWAYTTSFGPAVRIRRQRGRPFVVSTRNPQALCAAVDSAVGLDDGQEPRRDEGR